MTDFTDAQAKRWLEQEAAKHMTAASIRERIASEKKMAADPIMMKLAAINPVSAKAHSDLVAVLEASLGWSA